MARFFIYMNLALILSGLLLSSAAQSSKAVFRVKYLSADHVYLDAGTAAGLAVGDRMLVNRNGQMVAELRIVYVADHSASAIIISKQGKIVKGDAVSLLEKTAPLPVKPAEKEPQKQRIRLIRERKKTVRKVRRGSDLSGSIALQYYRWNDLEPTGLNFSQPTLRLNLRARRLWNRNFNLRIKTRSRHNQRSRRLSDNAPEQEWRNRIYEFSFSYDNPSAFLNYRVGRIISNTFSGVGYIDGLLLQQKLSDSFRSGVFAGTQPEWQYSDFQTSLQKYGAYLNYLRGDYSGSRFESTAALAGEYHGSTVSREFVYFQNSFQYGRTWIFYQSAELDINRNWRKESAGENISLTNLYLSGRWSPLPWITLGLMYDNRKNYRTYETRSIADSLFSEALRYGLRGSVQLLLPLNYRLFGNIGIRKRNTDTDYTTSFSGGLSKTNLFKYFSIFMNGSAFSNFFTRGVNYSLRTTTRILRKYSIELAGGGYQYELKSLASTRNNQWVRAGGRASLPAQLYCSGHYEYNWGGDVHGHRILAELGYRF